ncbi:T9SS type A sorting domain-containing protein [Halosquirtibacter xylanolyticus]|uniref:T9SS type A sorting domain-containing protein n=1 Tax=Halosquirtibacter xylanolyticus TaxID=3374599 RepID=UPI00374A5C02|nr:T9SS type A sorting domain-containing protein [Prolixibacteraceae bacterium]
MKKIYAFVFLLMLVTNLQAQNRFQLIEKLQGQRENIVPTEANSSYRFFNGYRSLQTLDNVSSVYAVVEDHVYTFKDGKVIGSLISDGTISFQSDVLEAQASYPSFLKYSSSNNSVYLGFTVYGNQEDYIYKVDISTGEWTQIAKLACNFDLEIYEDKMFISGLGYSDWNGIDDTNSIWMLPLDGSAAPKKVIEIPGNSCGLAISSNGAIVCGSYDLSNNDFGLYMWEYSDISTNSQKVLGIEDGISLANLDHGMYDCVFDSDDVLYWNVNSYSEQCSVVRYDYSSPSKYQKIMEANAGTWFTTLSSTSYNGTNSLWVSSFGSTPVCVAKSDDDRMLKRSILDSFEPNYPTKLIEYCPAPGQFVNTSSFGLKSIAELTLGNRVVNPFGRRLVTLGAWGGYIVYGFDSPILNHKDNPYGVDFTIIGNPFSGSSEPGIVKVMKDENGNGVADDTWYELRGSDHYLNTTKRDYSVTYTNPEGLADIPYVTSDGESGVVKYMVMFHKQNHYPEAKNFPDISQDQYTLKGTRLKSRTSIKSYVVNASFDYGYADNTPFNKLSNKAYIPDNPYTFGVQEGFGGDAFDINWAYDKSGNHVVLDQIDFVCVYNGVLQHGAALGEVSTEVSGICATKSDPSIVGVTDCIVSNQPENVGAYPIQNKGVVFVGQKFQFEAYVLSQGVPNTNQILEWSSDDNSIATIDDAGLLTGVKDGEVTISCTWAENREITRDFVIKVTPNKSTPVIEKATASIYVYPNPTVEEVRVHGVSHAEITVYSSVGGAIGRIHNYNSDQVISMQQVPSGIYFLVVEENGTKETLKFIKK